MEIKLKILKGKSSDRKSKVNVMHFFYLKKESNLSRSAVTGCDLLVIYVSLPEQ